MNTKYKRHQNVKLLRNPNVTDIEPYQEDEEDEFPEIKKGAVGEVNIILPNGNYHILIRDKKGNKLAYIVMDEDSLEAV